MRRRAAEVSALLDRRATLAQRRRLLVTSGWLALLGATVLVDLGDRARAAAARAAAASLGRETEHTELAAWAVEVATWTALIDQDWPTAARLAADGEALAPAGTSAAVQLAAQQARARIDLGLILARNGRADEAAHLAMLAADSGRLVPSNTWRVVEVDEALAARRDVVEVAELHERVRAARRA